MPPLAKMRALAVVVASVSMFACSESTDPGTGRQAQLRIVNSVFQGATPSSAIPVAIDVLVDSLTSGPGSVIALPPVSITTGTSGAQRDAGYTEVTPEVHSFVARVTGSANSTLFTSTPTSTYLPKQALTPFPFTLVVAGIAPASGLAQPTAVPYAMLIDDPFTPPADSINGGLTSRLHVINAAPFVVSSGAGNPVKANFVGASGTFSVTAAYRGTSPYINPPAGNYTLTITTTVGSTVTTLYSGAVVLNKGEVRTFVVQSTAYSATPGPANTKVTNILDNQF
jgi:hypothetical protein